MYPLVGENIVMVKLRRVYESILTLESKKDLDDLKVYLGDKLFDDYMKIRDKITKEVWS